MPATATARARQLPPAPSGTPLGQRLRDLRAERGLSVAALANRTGISFRRLYNAEYLNTFQGLELSELRAVAAALSVDERELIDAA